MYVERVPNRSSPPAVLLRESYREGGRIKKRTLANLSKLPHAAVEAVRRVLRGEPLVNPQEAFTCVRSLPHGHVGGALARQLGLHTLLATSRLGCRRPDRRPRHRQSKLATARALAPESAVSTLGEMLGLRPARTAAMDWRSSQAAIERLAKHLEEHTLVLYDLTSSYLEGTRLPVGPARPQPRRQEGHPADRLRPAVHVHGLSGGGRRRLAADPNTVQSGRQAPAARAQAGVLVGDRMLTDPRGPGRRRWTGITALRAPTIRKLVAAGTVRRRCSTSAAK